MLKSNPKRGNPIPLKNSEGDFLFLYPSFTTLTSLRILVLPLILLILILPITIFGQLSAGDIAFTGVNIDNPDQFSFIATTNIASGEIIYFTDRGFADELSSPGWNNTNEGIKKYTAPAEGLVTGDMVVISNSGSWQVIQGKGTIQDISGTGSFLLAADGDQIFAFQTEDTENYTPTFIAGIHMNYEDESGEDFGITNNFNWDSITITNTSYYMSDLPDALTNGANAIWIHDNYEKDNGKYNNTITSGTKSEINTSANNIANWDMHNSTIYSLGYPSSTSTIASGNWNEVDIWDATNGIPGKITDVTISHEVTVTADCASDSVVIAQTGAVTVTASETFTVSDTLSILSDASNSGSLIANGTITGVVSYQRHMTGNKWHLVASPVVGQNIEDLVTNSDNGIAFKDNNYGIMDYSSTSDAWNAYLNTTTISSAGLFNSGKGYSLRRTSDGVVSFTGTATTSNVSASISPSDNGWNLVGNPYPSAINATITAHATDNLLSVNSSNLNASYMALYLWDEADGYDGSQNSYAIINHARGEGTLDQDYVQAGQAFFVKAASGASTFGFTKAMQSYHETVPLKSGTMPWSTIKLAVSEGENTNFTTFMLDDKMTIGLEPGYDAGMLKTDGQMAIYSSISEVKNVDFALQCLPYPTEEEIVVQVGIHAFPGAEVSISSSITNMPAWINVSLKDRLTSKITILNKSGSYYAATLNDSITVGRFFLHLGYAVPTSLVNVENNIQVIPMSQRGVVNLKGYCNKGTHYQVFDMQGREIVQDELTNTYNNKISFHACKPGVYILRIKGAKQQQSYKIVY